MERTTPSNAGEWALLIEQAKAEDFRRSNADLFENDGEIGPEIYRNARGTRVPIASYDAMGIPGGGTGRTQKGGHRSPADPERVGEDRSFGIEEAERRGFHPLWQVADKAPSPQDDRVHAALETLDARDRTLVQQRYDMGMTLDAMAEEHGYVSRQAMEYHVKKALARFRTAYLAQTKDRSKRDG